jgi:hypothetical protein
LGLWIEIGDFWLFFVAFCLSIDHIAGCNSLLSHSRSITLVAEERDVAVVVLAILDRKKYEERFGCG